MIGESFLRPLLKSLKEILAFKNCIICFGGHWTDHSQETLGHFLLNHGSECKLTTRYFGVDSARDTSTSSILIFFKFFVVLDIRVIYIRTSSSPYW